MFGRAVASLLLLPLASCILEAPDDKESPAAEEFTLNINLTLPSSVAQTTRADGHDTDPGTEAENYIDFEGGDFRLLVFGADGQMVDGLFKDDFTYRLKSSAGTSAVYTLSGTMSVPDAETREKISKLHFMVLANWRSFERSNTRTSFYYPSFAGYGLKSDSPKPIYNEGRDLNFTFKAQTGTSWTPSIAQKRYIPMFGVTDELDLDYVVAMSHHSDSPISSIPMLRSMAKVEIVDVEGDLVSSVSLSQANASGRVIPDIYSNPSWNDNDIQVTAPSLPSVPGELKKIQFVRVEDNAQKQKVYAAYIPEMDLTDLRPEFLIYNGEKELKANFNNYDLDGKEVTDADKELKSVLRNHIYRFNVTAQSDNLYIRLNVLPWQMEYAENPWYFDAPQLADGGEIDWSAAIAEGYIEDKENLRLLMKDGTDDYAEAQFNIEAPRHCRWFAQLVPLNGKSDAFEFADGFDSGIIGDGPCIIRIRNTREIVSDYNNEARLVVFVEYPDKTTREIKVTPDGNGNYLIVQMVNNI